MSSNDGYTEADLTPQPPAPGATVRGRPRRLLLDREGSSNIRVKGVERKPIKYLKDIFVTLVDMKWRYVVLILFAAYFITYCVFAIVYWINCYATGQFDPNNGPGFKPCIENVDTFADAFLFSIETQSTLGFGTLHPNAECPGVTPLVYLQITIGFMIETIVLGLLLVKAARPKHRRHTLVFSRNACLCLEEGHLNFQIRVGDIRRTHLLDCTVHGLLVKRRVVSEKHVYPLFQHRMNFEAHGMGDKVFLISPLVLSHRITRHSPLYKLRPADLAADTFDILIFLEGTIESTGELCQARTCYASRDIMWSHRFVGLEKYNEADGTWCCNFSLFNNVVHSMTPKLSAQEYYHKLREEDVYENDDDDDADGGDDDEDDDSERNRRPSEEEENNVYDNSSSIEWEGLGSVKDPTDAGDVAFTLFDQEGGEPICYNESSAEGSETCA